MLLMRFTCFLELIQPKTAIKAATAIKELGTTAFKTGDFPLAQKKYLKALRCTSSLSPSSHLTQLTQLISILIMMK